MKVKMEVYWWGEAFWGRFLHFWKKCTEEKESLFASRHHSVRVMPIVAARAIPENKPKHSDDSRAGIGKVASLKISLNHSIQPQKHLTSGLLFVCEILLFFVVLFTILCSCFASESDLINWEWGPCKRYSTTSCPDLILKEGIKYTVIRALELWVY